MADETDQLAELYEIVRRIESRQHAGMITAPVTYEECHRLCVVLPPVCARWRRDTERFAELKAALDRIEHADAARMVATADHWRRELEPIARRLVSQETMT